MNVPVSTFTIFVSAVLSAATGFLTSRISQQSQRAMNGHTYRLAILAEVRGLHHRLLEYEIAYEQRVLTGQVSGAQVLQVLMQTGDTVVFNNNASSIGLFDRRTALRVLRFYADVRALHGRALVLSELSNGAPTPSVHAEVLQHLVMARKVRRRARFLVRRLRSERLRTLRTLRLLKRLVFGRAG